MIDSDQFNSLPLYCGSLIHICTGIVHRCHFVHFHAMAHPTPLSHRLGFLCALCVLYTLVTSTSGLVIAKSALETCVRDGSVQPSSNNEDCKKKLVVALTVSGAEVRIYSQINLAICF